ncbi:MAG: hypothetical protein LC624_01255 [Halobacteriales archaeon]|nr:hypothetical protein [Halobacteriales archaeon]
MPEDIYRKGLRLALDGRVELDAQAERASYYRVRGDSETHDVRIEASNAFNCTCTWGSLHAQRDGALCSHVVAVVVHRGMHAGAPLPEQDLAAMKGSMTLGQEPAKPKPRKRKDHA